MEELFKQNKKELVNYVKALIEDHAKEIKELGLKSIIELSTQEQHFKQKISVLRDEKNKTKDYLNNTRRTIEHLHQEAKEHRVDIQSLQIELDSIETVLADLDSKVIRYRIEKDKFNSLSWFGRLFSKKL